MSPSLRRVVAALAAVCVLVLVGGAVTIARHHTKRHSVAATAPTSTTAAATSTTAAATSTTAAATSTTGAATSTTGAATSTTAAATSTTAAATPTTLAGASPTTTSGAGGSGALSSTTVPPRQATLPVTGGGDALVPGAVLLVLGLCTYGLIGRRTRRDS
jgi:hypothetical protein